MRSPLLAVVTAFTVTGCALPSAHDRGSYVEAVPGVDATQLAQETASYLTSAYPPANTTFVIQSSSQSESAFDSSLHAALTKAGFGVADTSAAGLDQTRLHHVSYRVSNFDGKALVRLAIDQRIVTQLYGQDAQGLVAPVAAPAVRDDP